MIGDKLHYIEMKIAEGSMQLAMIGSLDFVPDKPIEEWESFRVIGESKNDVINEIINKLHSLKEKEDV